MSDIEKNPGGQEFHYSKDPTSLTEFLKAMLWISLGISVISLLSNFMQMNLLSGFFHKLKVNPTTPDNKSLGCSFWLHLL